MMSSSLRFLVLAVALLSGLSACDTPPKRPTYPDIRFTDEAPFRLAIASVDVVTEYRAPFHPPNVDHIFPVMPSHAMENWAHDRLQAAGGPGRAKFTTLNATVAETALTKKSEGLTATFTKEASERYDATVQATLQILDERGFPLRTVQVKASRSQTVIEGITPNDREKAWYEMTKALMADFDQQMDIEIRGNFAGYLQ